MLHNTFVDFFYLIKPFVPRRLQLKLRRKLIFNRINEHSGTWPIDPSAANPPLNWTGWPGEKKFAVILVHDVETQKGYDKCPALMKIDQEMEFCSSFNFVPERCYSLTPERRDHLRSNGFEVGVHDLKHDGKLFRSEKIFAQRAARINDFLKEWKSVGFRAGAMHCNLDWIHQLDIQYDSSTFDTDPFEPKPQGRRTIFPFFVPSASGKGGYVELPYTLPQDFTVFVLMRNQNIDIWKKKLDWIAEQGGMALITTHPDYMNLTGSSPRFDEYPVELYTEFLGYITKNYKGQYWNTLPKDMASFWHDNFRTT